MAKMAQVSTSKPATAAKLDAMHDAGVDLSAHRDSSKATRPGKSPQQRERSDVSPDRIRRVRPGDSRVVVPAGRV